LGIDNFLFEHENQHLRINGKLTKSKEDSCHIDLKNINLEYLKQYKEYVNELIIAIQNRTIRNSNGAVMGLIRGVSDYDELCADDTFWQLVTDADNYYCNECQSF
jgi:predicted RNase H-like nuclease